MEKSDFQFSQPCLVELSYKENHEFQMGKRKLTIEQHFNVNVTKKEEEKSAKVSLALTIWDAKEEAPFQLAITMAANFKWTNLTESQVDVFLKENAPALILSYMRPIVSTVTNASKFPIYNIPFMNFHK